jgi:hypothetical protein
MIHYIIWRVVFWAVCLYALVRGGKPERVAAVVLILADFISAAAMRSRHWQAAEPPIVVIDSCVAIFFVGFALKSSRWWPLWAAAFHFLAATMVIASLVGPPVRPYAYFVGELIWDYLGLFALLFGTHFEVHRDGRGSRPP